MKWSICWKYSSASGAHEREGTKLTCTLFLSPLTAPWTDKGGLLVPTARVRQAGGITYSLSMSSSAFMASGRSVLLHSTRRGIPDNSGFSINARSSALAVSRSDASAESTTKLEKLLCQPSITWHSKSHPQNSVCTTRISLPHAPEARLSAQSRHQLVLSTPEKCSLPTLLYPIT